MSACSASSRTPSCSATDLFHYFGYRDAVQGSIHEVARIVGVKSNKETDRVERLLAVPVEKHMVGQREIDGMEDTLHCASWAAALQHLDGDGLLGAQIGLGYGFGNGFRLESTFGYRGGQLEPSTTITGASILNLPPLTNGGYAVGGDGDIAVYDLMFNALYDFNPAGAVQPYLGAGIGLAKVDARATNLRSGVVTAGGEAMASKASRADLAWLRLICARRCSRRSWNCRCRASGALYCRPSSYASARSSS